MLADALRQHYGGQGLVCEYRLFKDIAQLRSAGLTLAVIEFAFMVDHYVLVLEVTDQQVIIADPLSGKRVMSQKEFKRIWRSLGIVLRRQANTG